MKSLNTRTTGFVTLVNVLLIALIGIITYMTSNPLALLALHFLQPLPVFQEMPPGLMQHMQQMDMDGEGVEVTAPEDDYDDTKAGFTARL